MESKQVKLIKNCFTECLLMDLRSGFSDYLQENGIQVTITDFKVIFTTRNKVNYVIKLRKCKK